MKLPPTNKEIEFKRWCIEQALKWPNGTNYTNQVAGGIGNYQQVDVINRADQIYNWVKK